MRGASLRDRIVPILPAGVALALWEGDDVPAGFPEETAAVARAVPGRVAAFLRGRACARSALAELGVPPVAIPVGEGRAPVWPAGFVGSITHCSGLVAAVAASAARLGGIGIDAEPAGPLPPGTDRLIVHPLDARGPGGRLDKVVFSAKESIFKALFPRTGIWLDFLDVALELDEERRVFRARRTPSAQAEAAGLAELGGAWVEADGLVVTVAWLEATTG